MIKFWLIVSVSIAGHNPTRLEQSEQPDLAACLSAVAAALEYSIANGEARDAAGKQVEFELAASCHIVKTPADPA